MAKVIFIPFVFFIQVMVDAGPSAAYFCHGDNPASGRRKQWGEHPIAKVPQGAKVSSPTRTKKQKRRSKHYEPE
jgi:hypothetical protein